jgi:2-desacetyl-2-hydroxyethyl bacteriochlorophyllide A dehydrogenase
VALREEEIPYPAPGQVLVQTVASGISPGTELLVYRGQAPADMAVDATIEALSGHFTFPLRYGYAAAGRVVAVGSAVDRAWQGRRVFAFQPHASHFLSAATELLPIPDGLSLEDAVFLPNMETAVNFVMDGRPVIGESVVVFGQGVVGLLTTALLARFPLARLITLDRLAARRRHSLALGASLSLDPDVTGTFDAVQASLREQADDAGADLTYELSGSPAALDLAIAVTGFSGRIVIGSWYGQKRVDLNLGGPFHRSRIRLISSQVSTLAPEWGGRWTKSRRLHMAWHMIEQLRPASLITHRIPIERASTAYALLDRHPEDAMQVILTYGT